MEKIGEACQFLRSFHKAERATIALAYKKPNSDQLEPLGNVPVSECDVRLLSIWKITIEDVYWTLSSVYENAPVTRQHPTTRLPITRRRIEDLQFLNGAWIDLDCHRIGMSPEHVYDSSVLYLLEHALPLPAWAIFSGRGLWLLWEFLNPVRSFPEKCDLLSRINRNLADRLKYLGADHACVDATRICRVLGSVNSKNGDTVCYRAIAGSRAVDMESLAKILEVPARKTALDGERVKKHRDLRNPAKVQAGYARWQTRRTDLLQILESRGKIKQGGDGRAGRRTFLFLFAALSMKAGVRGIDIRRDAYEIGQCRCVPPLQDREIEVAISQGLKARRLISDATLIAKLYITQVEIESLGLRIGQQRRVPRSRRKRDEIEERRQSILEISQEGRLPTRQMAKLLKLRGFNVSHVVVSKDYKLLRLPPSLDGKGILRQP